MQYTRPLFYKLLARIQEPRKFIQVIAGPRQVGKTTIALSLLDKLGALAEYHSADDSAAYSVSWIDQIWESLRIRMKLEKKIGMVLIIDEIQKISDWSSTVKKHWDRDTREKLDIKLVLIGSSRLLLMDGLSESLLGRYELSYAGHWGLYEMERAFGFTAEQYQWFGGYPGATGFVVDESRFKSYILNSIVEPTMIRDILMTAKIAKPALLRQLFEVGAEYSTQIVSFNRMLGQLQDAGNTTTLAKYLKLLEQAGLLSGLNKYSKHAIETKGTIPKFQVHNTALLSALKRKTYEETFSNPAEWGNVVENSVGAYLIEQVNQYSNASLYYWRENNSEIDYVVLYGENIIGIEVKSGDASIPEKASRKFGERFPDAKLLLVGKHGIPYEIFMKTELDDLCSAAM